MILDYSDSGQEMRKQSGSVSSGMAKGETLRWEGLNELEMTVWDSRGFRPAMTIA